MGFISDLVSEAIGIVAGVDSTLVEIITYKYHTASQVYDPATGTNTTATASLSVNSIRTSLTAEEAVNLDGDPDLELKSTDRIYMIAANDLGRAPALTDIIVSGGKNFRVVGWRSVPGDSLYKVVCRRP